MTNVIRDLEVHGIAGAPEPVMNDPLIDTVYICDWLPPDFGAVGQYSLLYTREMLARGQKVVLVD